MCNEWDEYADGWDDDPAARAYAEAAHRSLLGLADRLGRDLDGVRILDFGCGTGLLTERLVSADVEVEALDTAPAMLAVVDAKIERHDWSRVTTSDVLRADGEYDLIVCSSVCSFLDDYPATVVELVERLASGGMFVQWDWERDEADDEPHGLTREQIASAMTNAGLASGIVETAFELAMGDMSMQPLVGAGIKPAR